MNKSIKHPDWYFAKYNNIFSRGKSYDYEINLIDQDINIRGKTIQEVGSGTGEHAERILQTGSKDLDLIDKDIDSINILKEKFARNHNIRIIHGDGFHINTDRCYDVIICMYSIILQEIENIDELLNRLNNLLKQLKKNGKVCFEIINPEISKIIYPHRHSNIIYKKSERDLIKISSNYEDYKINIQFSGYLDNNLINYCIPIFALNIRDFVNKLYSYQIELINIKSLDKYGRRLLFILKKSKFLK